MDFCTIDVTSQNLKFKFENRDPNFFSKICIANLNLESYTLNLCSKIISTNAYAYAWANYVPLLQKYYIFEAYTTNPNQIWTPFQIWIQK